MEIQKQVTTIESSKRLIELGVKQEAGLYWVWTVRGAYDAILRAEELENSSYHWIYNAHKPIPAFGVAELGELIPPHIALPYKDAHSGWFAPTVQSWCQQEVDARAATLIFYLENLTLKK
jgi:hypothetical protein